VDNSNSSFVKGSVIHSKKLKLSSHSLKYRLLMVIFTYTKVKQELRILYAGQPVVNCKQLVHSHVQPSWWYRIL